MEWMQLAQLRVQCQGAVNTKVMKLRVLETAVIA
jgi:hypothetical protein